MRVVLGRRGEQYSQETTEARALWPANWGGLPPEAASMAGPGSCCCGVGRLAGVQGGAAQACGTTEGELRLCTIGVVAGEDASCFFGLLMGLTMRTGERGRFAEGEEPGWRLVWSRMFSMGM